MPYKLVIFDFDGTLADSAACSLEIFNETAEQFRFRKVNPDEIEELRGLNSREIIRRLGVPIWKLPLIARHMRRLAAEKAHRTALFPGIAPMIEDLARHGLRIVVLSSNAETTIRLVLGESLAASIDEFECGISLFGKARGIRRILKRCGIARSEAILIGDETRDMEAALKARIPAAAVFWGYATPAAFETFSLTATFSTVEEMAEFLSASHHL